MSSQAIHSYYTDKLSTLQDIFGTEALHLSDEGLHVGERIYPIVDDVIVLLEASQYPPFLQQRFAIQPAQTAEDFAEDIQFTFGEEWQKFPEILPEHEREFAQYFDLVDMAQLSQSRVCDLGCGSGRWSSFIKCRELILVDFSEAIFIARRNIQNSNALFFMGDLTKLPFREGFADFLFCLGVLHTLPMPALGEVRAFKKYAPLVLIYLYYALDNRPFYFRVLLALVTQVRRVLSRLRDPVFRNFFVWTVAITIYLPLVGLGRLLQPLGWSHYVPLYEAYHRKSLKRIRQDVYDRFFTRIEQRFSRKQIMELEDTFSKVQVSDTFPFWHFLCRR